MKYIVKYSNISDHICINAGHNRLDFGTAQALDWIISTMPFVCQKPSSKCISVEISTLIRCHLVLGKLNQQYLGCVMCMHYFLACP